MFNKMLLSHREVSLLPVNPYEEDYIEVVQADLSSATEGIDTYYSSQSYSFLFLPTNYCTVLFEVTDELYEQIKGKCDPFYSDIRVSVTDNEGNSLDILEFGTMVGGESWTPTTLQRYVQFNFTTESTTAFIRVDFTGCVNNDTTTTGTPENPVSAYMMARIFLTNEAHAHGPDDGWIMTI